MLRSLVLLPGVALLPTTSFAQQEGTLHSVETNVFRPEQPRFSNELLEQLEVPEGFQTG